MYYLSRALNKSVSDVVDRYKNAIFSHGLCYNNVPIDKVYHDVVIN